MGIYNAFMFNHSYYRLFVFMEIGQESGIREHINDHNIEIYEILLENMEHNLI